MSKYGVTLARYIVVVLSLSVLLTVTSCSSDEPDEEGGISGTGLILRGSVNDRAFALNNTVEIKSSDGELTQLPIDTASGQFGATSLNGISPWVLRVRLSANRSMYGIAFDGGTRNINGFSDLALRNWFAQQSLDIDKEFAASGSFSNLPSISENNASLSSVFELVEPVLTSYGSTGNDVVSGDYLVGDGVVEAGFVGIDAFLKRNAVLIENGLVSFVITDPSTKTQSVTQSPLALGKVFSDNSSIAPIQNGSVRALGSAVDEIILVWEPSTDDVAVVAYQVIRDGTLIATTPYPVYIDSGLAAQSYTYEVIAVDAAGNKSEASAPVLASALQTSDDIPPPAPTVLIALAVSSSRIELIWGQDNIQDVASFNLFRGTNAQSLNEVLLRLTSSVAIDTAVVKGQTYCYQVEAVDASGNKSERSDVLCVTASDDDMPNGGSDEPLIDWIVPDVDALACSQTLSSAQVLQGLTVLDAGCYLVPESLTVGAGATLRLSAGVVLKFAEAAKLAVSSSGTLTANGTAAAPVVLSGSVSTPGYWGGVEFQNSTSVGNLLRGSVIQYAGGGDSLAAISVTQGRARFRIEDTLVRYNQKRAIHFSFNSIAIDEFKGNRITENVSIGQVTLDLLSSLAGNSDFTGNTKDVLNVLGNRYPQANIAIPDLGVPLAWGGVVMDRGDLSIDPGVVLEMVPGALISVDGAFTAIGTVDKPIVMQGRSDTTLPNWEGLLLMGRGDKTLNHVTIRDGGASAVSTGAIDLMCNPDTAVKFSIDNVDISDSASWGIYVDRAGCDIDIGNNVNYFNNELSMKQVE